MFHIVDDNSSVREILSELLEDFGHAVRTFACPNEYITHVNSPNYVKPIATFTDIHMPAMNGFEMIDRLIETNPCKKFVVMSGNAEGYVEFKNRVCMYLCKPFHMDCLEKILHALMSCDQLDHISDEECSVSGCHQERNIQTWVCPHLPKEICA